MPTIIAICPYCRAGGVRAPDWNIGASATCPNCKSSFTVMPSDGLPGWAKEEKPPAAAPKPSPVEETHQAAAVGMADVTEPSPLLSDDAEVPPPSKARRKPSGETAQVPAPQPADDEAAEPADMGIVLALVALILVGVAVVASQFPFGRFIAVGVAGLGLAGGLASLGAEGRARLAGGVAVGLHALVLLIVILLPSWLRLDAWRGAATDDGPKGPVALEHGTGVATPLAPADWVDAGKSSWEFKDVRVTVRAAFVGPLDRAKGAKKGPREQYLHLRVRVSNSGVEREIPLSGWAAGVSAEGVRVTDPAGRVLRPATAEEVGPTDRSRLADRLFPGNASEPRLLFAAPAGKVEWLRVQLPGSAFGMSEETIQFQLGSSFLARNAAP
jgi:hypothetical protein